MALRYKEIGEIISLIDASSCDEFVLETDEIKLVVRRRGTGGEGVAPASAPTAPPATAPRGSASDSPETAAAAAAGAESGRPAPPDKPTVVSSPMVGTFYRAPAPDEPPFVEVGSKVKPGDPLCLIEVMKLFTTVYAEFAGIVREIGAEDGQLVEYGQMLFVVEAGEDADV